MKKGRKLAAAVMAAALAAAIAVPASSAVSADIAVVEQEYLAGTATSISKLSFGKITDQAYTGKAIKPEVTVKNGSKTLKAGTDYTVSYKNNIKIGTASVTIKGKGKYTGGKTLTFKIVPAKPTLTAKTSGNKLSFSWSKAKGASGYQLYYSVNGGAYKKLATSGKTAYTTSKLDVSKNSYSFKLRGYKKVSGKTYYGLWSKAVSAGKSGTTGTEEGEFKFDNLNPSGNAGTIKYMGYYDITSDDFGKEQSRLFQSEDFGGEIEYISVPYLDYADKLALSISADASPDIVTNDVFSYPHRVIKRYFTPLDDYINSSSALWKGMKPMIDSYAWDGKHYYYPHTYTASYALNYNKKTISDNGLQDPYTLYKNGKWTWEAWRDMMAAFCEKSTDNVGYYATVGTINGFVYTTGTPFVDVLPSGTIMNNLASPNISRAMQFIESLYTDGLFCNNQYGEWVSPEQFAESSDKILFYVNSPKWTYTAATTKMQNPVGVDNDIHDTVSDFSFVPFPRDTKADKYYQGCDTFGFLVPTGAKNVKGAVEFINLFRAYEVDAGIRAQVKKNYTSPDPVYFTGGKYEGSRKWQITWGETEYNMLCELENPASFSHVFDDMHGISYNDPNVDGYVYSSMFGKKWADNSNDLSKIYDTLASEISDDVRTYTVDDSNPNPDQPIIGGK